MARAAPISKGISAEERDFYLLPEPHAYIDGR